MGGGHQSQLIQRQRPHPLRGQRQRHRLGPTVDQLAEKAAKRWHVRTTAERESSRKRLGCQRSSSNDERVEPDSLARSGHSDAVVGIDLRDRVPDQVAATLVPDDLAKVGDAGLATLERLGHRHRAIQELALR
jgi:hypothetical protein